MMVTNVTIRYQCSHQVPYHTSVYNRYRYNVHSYRYSYNRYNEYRCKRYIYKYE